MVKKDVITVYCQVALSASFKNSKKLNYANFAN